MTHWKLNIKHEHCESLPEISLFHTKLELEFNNVYDYKTKKDMDT